jgi:hypothetical protein
MIDLRSIVGRNLQLITENVKMSKPDGDITLPLICYSETNITALNIAYDQYKYRVAAYASTFEDLVNIVSQIDETMCGDLGMAKAGKTADGDARIGTDLYLCRLDYTCNVNKIYDYIVRNSQK